MGHPYVKAAHTNDPKWINGLDKYKEKAKAADTERAVVNYGGDAKVTKQATYITPQKGK